MKTYSEATRNLEMAACIALSGISTGNRLVIRTAYNSDCDHPIKIANPELDDWRNWVSSYGVPKPIPIGENTHPTQQLLMEEFHPCFGTQEAVEHYFATGEATAGNFKGMGICHPVRNTDIEAWFSKQGRGGECKGYYWHYAWNPKEGIQYWITDPAIKEVFVVVTDADLTREECLADIGRFLVDPPVLK